MMHESLRQALHDGNAVEARRLLSDPAIRAGIDEPVFGFNSPAIVAFAGDATLVDLLLEFGADPNRKSDWWAGGFHALYSATGASADRLIAAGATIDACAAAHLGRVDVLRELIAGDPGRVHERGGDGQTPLHFAATRAVVDELLDAGADINARDVDHRSTPAHWMLKGRRGAGRYDLARYLVDRGAEADIFLAAALGLTERARALLQENPSQLTLVTGLGEYGEKPPGSFHIYYWTIGSNVTPLDVAMQFEQHDTLEAMLEFASLSQRFVFACRREDAATARRMAREHPDLVASLTPDEHRAIAHAAWNNQTGAVALMLELGFNPRATGQDSGTPLHLAAWEGSPATVAAILRHPDARELLSIKEAHYGGTPLGWCCHGSIHGNRSHDHAGVAKLLLEAGAERGPDARHASAPVLAVLEDWPGGQSAGG